MSESFYNSYCGKLKAVIFDWAGTTIDYGCFGPTGVFIEIFRQKGIELTEREARGPMGMHKRDHICALTNYPRIAEEWRNIYGRDCNDQDIEAMFNSFIPLQLSVLEKYSTIVPELPDALNVVKSMNLKIGSTTGYNTEMMDIVTKSAARQGYTADSVVCASEVSAGRPAPWMAFKTAERLGIYPMQAIVKIGDTISDIQEGNNAGMWSVGVVMSSNEMGLTTEEISMLDHQELDILKRRVRNTFKNAGADYVIDDLSEIEELLDKINSELACGEKP